MIVRWEFRQKGTPLSPYGKLTYYTEQNILIQNIMLLQRYNLIRPLTYMFMPLDSFQIFLNQKILFYLLII